MGDCPDPGSFVASDESVVGRRAITIVHLFEYDCKQHFRDERSARNRPNRCPDRSSPREVIMAVDRIVPNLRVADVGAPTGSTRRSSTSAWAWTSAGSATSVRPTRSHETGSATTAQRLGTSSAMARCSASRPTYNGLRERR